MCAVIDPPLFIPILDTKNPKNIEFGLLKNWVMSGSGKIIIGGTQYRQELSRVGSVLPFIAELSRRGRTVSFDNAKVDAAAGFATTAANTNQFDDPHLVGLVAISGCQVVCVDDARSHRFLKDKRLYVQGSPPKLFTSARNAKLLTKKYSAPCCRSV